MKSKKLLLLAMLVLMLGQVNLIASGTANLVTAKEDLNEQIWDIVSNVPVDLLSFNASNVLTISFRVNENGELTSIEVESQNDLLAQYVKMRIEEESLLADSRLSGKKCRVSVSYKDQIK